MTIALYLQTSIKSKNFYLFDYSGSQELIPADIEDAAGYTVE